MAFDTHCHLDAQEFVHDRDAVIQSACEAGVTGIVIPAVTKQNFDTVRLLAHRLSTGAYALGIHPLFVPQAKIEDLDVLRQYLEQYRDDPKLVAVGEIGLDLFEPHLKQAPLLNKQIDFFKSQLELAKTFELPVILHVRRAQDLVLKYLRQARVSGGIAHAFNGSFQQAQQFIDLGFALGMGGALTYTRALQIRRLAINTNLEHLVLETDSPDIAPEWVEVDSSSGLRRNSPDQVMKIAQVLADLRQCDVSKVISVTDQTAQRVLPKLNALN
jgi:TatD DNase family protein